MTSTKITHPAVVGDAIRLAERSLRKGQIGQAAALFSKAVEQDPRNVALIARLAQTLVRMGDYVGARKQFDKAIRLQPDNPALHGELGALFMSMRLFDKAVFAFRKAVKLSKGHPFAIAELSKALRLRGDLENALSVLEDGLARHPLQLELIAVKARLQSELGRLSEAVATLSSACRKAPDNPSLLLVLANLKKDTGDYHGAVTLYEQLLKIDPDCSEAYRHHARLVKRKALLPLDQEMISRLEKDDLAPQVKAGAAFGLAKVYDDIGDVARGWDYLSRANAFQRSCLDYQVEDDIAFLSEVAATVDQAFLKERAGWGFRQAGPIFVLGFPRSGTTLVEQILSAHSLVTAGGELEDFQNALTEVAIDARGGLSIDGIRHLTRKDIQQAGQFYWKRVRQRTGAGAFVTDKLPGNFAWAGLIKLVLPNARIIHCSRDPLDTCLSAFKAHFTEGQSFAFDLTELGRYYRAYRQIMLHWQSVLGADLFEVSYEDLVDNPDQQIRRLLTFCGLPWEEACLHFHEQKNVVTTASAPQVRQPIYRSSLKASDRYRPYLQPLLQELGLEGTGPTSV